MTYHCVGHDVSITSTANGCAFFNNVILSKYTTQERAATLMSLSTVRINSLYQTKIRVYFPFNLTRVYAVLKDMYI